MRRSAFWVGGLSSERGAISEKYGDVGEVEPVPVRDEYPRRLDGSRIRRFNSNVGGFFSKRNAGDDNSKAEPVAVKCENPGRVDDSRMRGFKSNAGGFFSRNKAGDDSGDDGNSAETATQSRSRRAHRFNSNAGSLTSKHTQSRPPPLRSILQKVSPCLTCGHPTCTRHSSSAFSKKNIPMCQLCAYLFELDFIVDTIASAASSSDFGECRRRVNEMVDCYD